MPILVAGAALVSPAAAGGAEVVGSNLASTPVNAPVSNSTRIQSVQPTGVTLPLTPTASGVIVSIALKHGGSGANPGISGLRILSGTLPTLTARIPAELTDFTPANLVAGTLNLTPTVNGVPGGAPKGIPIETGERVGYTRIGGTSGQALLVNATGLAGAERRFTNSAHNSGEADYSSAVANQETTIQYLVEPDADRDGFGDETQDLCSTNALTQGACPSASPPLVAPSPVANTVAKTCKKPKKEKGARAAAKKKPKGCRKPKRKKK